jgi:hypothetical protein
VGLLCALACGTLTPASDDDTDASVVDVDGGTAADSACKTVDAFLCSDFDEPDAFGGWVINDIGQGFIQVTNESYVSAPSALRTSFVGGTEGGTGVTAKRLEAALPPSASRVRFSFSLKPEVMSYAFGGLISVAEIYCKDPDYDGAWIFLKSDGAYLYLSNGQAGQVDAIKVGEWTRVSIDLFLIGVTKTEVTINGSVRTFQGIACSNTAKRTELSVHLGISEPGGQTNHGSGTADYDDVLVEIDPQ